MKDGEKKYIFLQSSIRNMKIIVAVILFIHGFAHLVGFVVSWQISKLEEMPYKTTLFGGLIDVGDTGIRLVGLVWLLFTVAFFAAAGLLVGKVCIWDIYTLIISGLSLVLCITGWPDSKIGILVNVGIIIFIVIVRKTGWI